MTNNANAESTLMRFTRILTRASLRGLPRNRFNHRNIRRERIR